MPLFMKNGDDYLPNTQKKTLEETFCLNKTKLVTGAIGKKILEKRNLGKESETIHEMRNQS